VSTPVGVRESMSVTTIVSRRHAIHQRACADICVCVTRNPSHFYRERFADARPAHWGASGYLSR
jgi:hypothetical protein